MKNILIYGSVLAAASAAAFYIIKNKRSKKWQTATNNIFRRSRHRIDVFNKSKNHLDAHVL